MAASSSEPSAAADLIQHDKRETPFPSDNNELFVTMTTEVPGPALGSDARAELTSSDSATTSLIPAKALEEEEEEEATPTPPESSSLSSENGTVTVATTEEESLSVLLGRNVTNGGPDGGREPGKSSDQVQDLSLAPSRPF